VATISAALAAAAIALVRCVRIPMRSPLVNGGGAGA
jgi:hypothetical protein